MRCIMKNSAADIIAAAKKEVNDDDFRTAVDAEKKRIIDKRNRSIWKKLFPFKIKIVRI